MRMHRLQHYCCCANFLYSWPHRRCFVLVHPVWFIPLVCCVFLNSRTHYFGMTPMAEAHGHAPLLAWLVAQGHLRYFGGGGQLHGGYRRRPRQSAHPSPLCLAFPAPPAFSACRFLSDPVVSVIHPLLVRSIRWRAVRDRVSTKVVGMARLQVGSI